MFRVYVVEPQKVEPPRHTSLFLAALQPFLPRSTSTFVLGSQPAPVGSDLSGGDRFDLLAFPEAFLPAKTLIDTFRSLGKSSVRLGCVHTGLRPTDQQDATHLFEPRDLAALLGRLSEVPNMSRDDLNPFKEWLAEQASDERFNVGCLFTVDAANQIRVCLHAKLVRSKFEGGPDRETYMKEANLLSLVTLRPTNVDLSSVTIQPLICSDLLHLDTDVPKNHPIPAISSHRSVFPQLYADEVDLVSVATCSPNTRYGRSTLKWHQKFRESFVRAASHDDCRRHRYAAFVLANFRIADANSQAPGGLSGIFMPLPMYKSPYEQRVSPAQCIYGHFKDDSQDDEPVDDERWVSMDGRWPDREKRPILGYIVGLGPGARDNESLATMFGFTVSGLPRPLCQGQLSL